MLAGTETRPIVAKIQSKTKALDQVLFYETKLPSLDRSRTPQDMDGTLTLIFAKLETI